MNANLSTFVKFAKLFALCAVVFLITFAGGCIDGEQGRVVITDDPYKNICGNPPCSNPVDNAANSVMEGGSVDNAVDQAAMSAQQAAEAAAKAAAEAARAAADEAAQSVQEWDQKQQENYDYARSIGGPAAGTCMLAPSTPGCQ